MEKYTLEPYIRNLEDRTTLEEIKTSVYERNTDLPNNFDGNVPISFNNK